MGRKIFHPFIGRATIRKQPQDIVKMSQHTTFAQ